MFGILFRPLIYLKIKINGQPKFFLDYILPLVIAVFLSAFLCFLNFKHSINVFDPKFTLISSISGFVQTLPGFFIAALAAIVSFANSDMDEPMDPPKPYIYDENGNPKYDYLTRRRLLSYLFSYLTYISIIGYFAIVLITFLQSFSINLPLILIEIGYFICCLVPIALIVQIITLTFLSLWYLGERIHFNGPHRSSSNPPSS